MKIVLSVFITAIFLYACSGNNGNKNVVIPAVYKNIDKENFSERNGYTVVNNQTFSGWQFALYPNGDTALLTSFINGKATGISRQWYPNKQLKEWRQYKNGDRTGEHRGWWENGTLKFIHHYWRDLFDGSLKEWYADGIMYKDMFYEKGYEKGLQKIWRPDGRLHANYEVRNGRYYGLTGAMHCKNIWKDAM